MDGLRRRIIWRILGVTELSQLQENSERLLAATVAATVALYMRGGCARHICLVHVLARSLERLGPVHERKSLSISAASSSSGPVTSPSNIS